MVTEEKQLLFRDLCARLPYGVEASVRGSDEECISFEVLGIKGDLVWVRNKMLLVDHFETIEVIKPYLRPMSSMTEEEEKELKSTLPFSISFSWDVNNEFIIYTDSEYDGDHYFSCFVDIQDWLNAHHFDYRNLIEKGLALEASEGMYESKNN